MREVTLSAGGDVLSQICDASGLKLQDLMLWGRVGHHKVTYVAQPQEALAVLTTARGERGLASVVPCWGLGVSCHHKQVDNVLKIPKAVFAKRNADNLWSTGIEDVGGVVP